MMELSYEQVSKMLELSKVEAEINPKYNLLYKRDLKEYWESRIDKANTFSLYISGSDVDMMDFSKLQENIEAWKDVISVNNFIQINNEGVIIDQMYIDATGAQIKEELVSKSKSFYVFFFGEEGVTRYINGVAYEPGEVGNGYIFND